MTKHAGKLTTLATAAALAVMFAAPASAQDDTLGVSVGLGASAAVAANVGASASVTGLGGLVSGLLGDIGGILGGVGLGGII
jgi:hypothetical protein